MASGRCIDETEFRVEVSPIWHHRQLSNKHVGQPLIPSCIHVCLHVRSMYIHLAYCPAHFQHSSQSVPLTSDVLSNRDEYTYHVKLKTIGSNNCLTTR